MESVGSIIIYVVVALSITTSVARAASRPVMRLREVSERELSPGFRKR